MIKSLKHLRDTRLAHHDTIVATSMPLTYGDVLQLVDHIKSVYNVLRRGHNRNTISFGYLGEKAEKGTSAVVYIMCEERDRAKQRIEEAMKLSQSSISPTPLLYAQPWSRVVSRKEWTMLWNGDLQAFLDWFVAPTAKDEAKLKAALRSVPNETWATVSARLNEALDNEELTFEPRLNESWSPTVEELQNGDYEGIKRKQQLVTEETIHRKGPPR